MITFTAKAATWEVEGAEPVPTVEIIAHYEGRQVFQARLHPICDPEATNFMPVVQMAVANIFSKEEHEQMAQAAKDAFMAAVKPPEPAAVAEESDGA